MNYWDKPWKPTQVAPLKSEMSSEENLLVSQMKPLLFTLRLMGLFPYSMSSTGELMFELKSPVFLYSVTVVSVIMALTAWNQILYLQPEMNQNTNFRRTLNNFTVFVFFCPVHLIPLTHWPEMRKKVRFFNSWKKLQKTKSMPSPALVQNYRQLWLQLSLLVQDLGSSMGLTFGGGVLLFFALHVLSIYSFLFNLRLEAANTIFQCFITLFTGGLIFLQCDYAHCTTQEVGRKFSNCVQALEHVTPGVRKEVREELQVLLDTVTRNEPMISYCGFVSVNRNLYVSLSSAMVTYIVVLMQFQISSEEENSSSSSNKTASVHG